MTNLQKVYERLKPVGTGDIAGSIGRQAAIMSPTPARGYRPLAPPPVVDTRPPMGQSGSSSASVDQALRAAIRGEATQSQVSITGGHVAIDLYQVKSEVRTKKNSIFGGSNTFFGAPIFWLGADLSNLQCGSLDSYRYTNDISNTSGGLVPQYADLWVSKETTNAWVWCQNQWKQFTFNRLYQINNTKVNGWVQSDRIQSLGGIFPSGTAGLPEEVETGVGAGPSMSQAPVFRSATIDQNAPLPAAGRGFNPNSLSPSGELTMQQELTTLRRLQAANSVDAGGHLYGRPTPAPVNYPRPASGSGHKSGLYELPAGLGLDSPGNLVAQVTPLIQNLIDTKADAVGLALKADTTKKLYIAVAVATVAGAVLGIVGSRYINKRR